MKYIDLASHKVSPSASQTLRNLMEIRGQGFNIVEDCEFFGLNEGLDFGSTFQPQPRFQAYSFVVSTSIGCVTLSLSKNEKDQEVYSILTTASEGSIAGYLAQIKTFSEDSPYEACKYFVEEATRVAYQAKEKSNKQQEPEVKQ